MSYRPVTSRDVARLADVHRTTVSRVLNPQTRTLVNPRTARRVLAAVESLGYTPNAIAQAMRTHRTRAIGVLIQDITNPLYPPILRGIQDTLEAASYTALIVNTDDDAAREELALRGMLARRVDGLIATTARRGHLLLAEAWDSALPVVLVLRTALGAALPSVDVDDDVGVRLAVGHLAALGHSRVAHVAGPDGTSTAERRLAAFKRAVLEFGLDRDGRLIAHGEAFTEEEGARAFGRLLEATDGLTAVVAATDLMALGCLEVLEHRGLSCPRHVSVVGYGDLPLTDRVDPPLTTVHVPHYELGCAGAELLLDVVGGERIGSPQRELAPSLVIRESTARRAGTSG